MLGLAVLLGVAALMVAFGAPLATSPVVGVANALIFGFIGVDWFLGGRHHDLSRFEPGPILTRGSDGE